MQLVAKSKLLLYASFAGLVTSQTTAVDYCSALEGVIEICEASTSGWLDLPASQQASCACGTALGTIPWGPTTYDLLASACASQYATIDVTLASDARGLEAFCTGFVAQVASTLSTTTAAFPSVTSQGSTPSQTSQTAFFTSSQSQQTGFFSSSQSQQTGLFTSMTPTTVVSVVTVSPTSSSSKGGVEPLKNVQNPILSFLLPVFGMLMGIA